MLIVFKRLTGEYIDSEESYYELLRKNLTDKQMINSFNVIGRYGGKESDYIVKDCDFTITGCNIPSFHKLENNEVMVDIEKKKNFDGENWIYEQEESRLQLINSQQTLDAIEKLEIQGIDFTIKKQEIINEINNLIKNIKE